MFQCANTPLGMATHIFAQNHMFFTRWLSVVICIKEYKIHTVFYNVIYND